MFWPQANLHQREGSSGREPQLFAAGSWMCGLECGREWKEGLVWGNKTGPPICRESWRYLIMSLVHLAQPSEDRAGRKSETSAGPSDTAQEDASEANGWHTVTGGWLFPASTQHFTCSSSPFLCSGMKMKKMFCFPDLWRRGSPGGHSCAWVG